MADSARSFPLFNGPILGEGYHTKALTEAEIAEKYGITYFIGAVHSHPADWFNSLGVSLIVRARLVRDFEGFSTPDLYAVVNDGELMTGVVEKSYNYFAFRTAETKDLPPDSPLKDSRAFSRHWERKYGGHFLGESNNIFWASPKYSLRSVNMGIAEEYNLALYKGKPGGDLIREYPSL